MCLKWHRISTVMKTYFFVESGVSQEVPMGIWSLFKLKLNYLEMPCGPSSSIALQQLLTQLLSIGWGVLVPNFQGEILKASVEESCATLTMHSAYVLLMGKLVLYLTLGVFPKRINKLYLDYTKETVPKFLFF